jgi:hypothetical protein
LALKWVRFSLFFLCFQQVGGFVLAFFNIFFSGPLLTIPLDTDSYGESAARARLRPVPANCS